jgi:glutamyl-tRNA reductase
MMLFATKALPRTRHLLGVTASLDSMVLGETEITDQTKNAYEIARAGGLTGRVLSRLSESFSGGEGDSHSHRDWSRRRLNQERGRGIGGKNFGADLADRSIMLIGTGQTAECCVRLLIKGSARSILISNRSLDRALDLANQQ